MVALFTARLAATLFSMSKNPAVNNLGDTCDFCGEIIPFSSRNIVFARFRIGSFGGHEFTVHKTCIVDQLRSICSSELQ